MLNDDNYDESPLKKTRQTVKNWDQAILQEILHYNETCLNCVSKLQPTDRD